MERQEGGESYSEGVLSRSGAAGSGVAGGAATRRRWRHTSGSGRRGACRGGSADHEEASLGVNLSRGGAEQGVPRRAAAGGGSVRDGGDPTALGGGGRVVEHRWEVGELVAESVWVEKEWKG